MTNYNERRDEIFETLNNKAREERTSCTERNNWEGYNSAYERLEHDAKQAFTSLIKELVAEAKPEKRELIEPVTGKPVSSGDKVTVDVEADPRGSLIFVQNNGYNMALNQFEQNLLKALEEV